MNLRRTRLAFFAAFLLLISASFSKTAHAQHIRTFSWQGVLSEKGQPISPGFHKFTIQLFGQQVGGSPLFQEDQNILVVNGMVNMEIGATSPVPLSFSSDTDYYLSLAIDGGNELTPRNHITAQPLSFRALTADQALSIAPGAKGFITSLNGMDGALMLTSDSTMLISKNATGFVFSARPQTQVVALRTIRPSDSSIAVSGTTSDALISVRDTGITTPKLHDGAVTSGKLADRSVVLSKLALPSNAFAGSVIKWNGSKWDYAQDSVASYLSGPGIVISGDTIRAVYPPPTITVANSTLRSSGSGWVENTALLANASGDITAHSITLDGTSTITGAGSLSPSGAGVITANSYIGTLAVANGGTGLATLPAGQFLVGNGTGNVTTASLAGTNGVTVAGTTIGLTNPLPAGTTPNSTLRWNGMAWAENPIILSTAAGALSATSLNLSGKATSQSTVAADPGTTLVTKDFLSGNIATLTDAATILGDGTSANRIRLNLNNPNTWTAAQTIATGASVIPSGSGVVAANQFIGAGSVTNAVDLATNEVNGVLGVANGGTGSTALTDHSVLLGSGGSPVRGVMLTSGQVLVGSTGADPVATTLTAGAGVTITNASGAITISASPLANGTTNNSTLRWNGTNWVENTASLATSAGALTAQSLALNAKATSASTIATDAATTLVTKDFLSSPSAGIVASQFVGTGSTTSAVDLGTAEVSGILPVANGGTGASTFTANGVLLGNGANALTTQTLSNGQILLGTAGAPTAVTLTAGSGITFSNSANALTISSNAAGVGTTLNSTLRWNGTNWIENTGLLATSAGAMTAQSLALSAKGTSASTSAADAGGTLVTKDFLSSASSNIVATQFVGSGSTSNAVDLATAEVNGVLPIANGGTGASTFAANSILLGNGANAFTTQTLSNGQILLGTAGAPSAVTLTAGTGITLSNTANTLTINSSAAGAGTTVNSTLRWNGTNWVENTGLVATSAGAVSAQSLALSGKASSASTAVADAASTLVTKDYLSSAASNIVAAQFVGNGSTSNAVDLSTAEVNGVLPVANGGTGASTIAANGIVIGNGASALTAQTLTNGQLLIGSTGAAPAAATLIGGAGVTITNGPGAITISSNGGIANGTTTNSTLRWSGTNWVENTGLTATSAGAVTAQTLNLSAKATSASTAVADAGSTLVTKDFLSSANSGIVATQFVGTGSVSSAVDLSTAEVNGVLPIANGGTGQSAIANHSVVIGRGTAAVSTTTLTDGQLLIGSTGNDPSAAALVAGSGISITNGPGSITIASSSPVLPSGTTSNSTLRWNGTNWVENANITSTAAGALSVVGKATSASTAAGDPGSTLVTKDFLTTLSNAVTSDNLTVLGDGSSANSLRLNLANANTWTASQSFANGLVLGANSPLTVGGSVGTSGYVLSSQGAGISPSWVSAGSLVTSLGFDKLATATNTTAVMTVGSGARITPSGSGIIAATQFVGPGSVTNAVDLSTAEVAGTLQIVNGGTNGAATPTAGGIPYGDGSQYRFTAAGSSGQVLTSNGAGAPQWLTPGGLTGWSMSGNSGTTPGTNFVGTTDNSAFEIHVNNAGLYAQGSHRVMRYEPTNLSPNLIGGYYSNTVQAGVVGATIGGGGDTTEMNTVTDNFGTIAGGKSNLAGDNGGTVATAEYATVGGGALNSAKGQYAVIAGGYDNTINEDHGFIGGGDQNVLGSGPTGQHYSVIAGGDQNTATGTNSSILGGHSNTAGADYSVIGGGYLNNAIGTKSFIGAGNSNTIQNSTSNSAIVAGNNNIVAATEAAIGGGNSNTVYSNYSSIAGGVSNIAGVSQLVGTDAFVGGGFGNVASGQFSSVSGGSNDTASATYSFVGGGSSNAASGVNSGIGSGSANKTSGQYAFVGGGQGNVASAINSAVLGGTQNSVTAGQSAVLGGTQNSVSGSYSAIAGGQHLTLGGSSFGFNNTISQFDVSALPNIAYFGDVSILLGNDDNTARELRFYGPNSNTNGLGTTHYTSLKAGTSAANVAYTLPTSAPVNSGSVLASTSTGVMSWATGVVYDPVTPGLSVGGTAANTTLDVNGDVAIRTSGKTLSNGANNSITLPATSIVRITGPTAAFSITGLSGGVDGKIIVLFNATANNMTINHNDAGSGAIERIYCQGGTNVTVTQYGTVQLFYSGTDSKWVVMGKN